MNEKQKLEKQKFDDEVNQLTELRGKYIDFAKMSESELIHRFGIILGATEKTEKQLSAWLSDAVKLLERVEPFLSSVQCDSMQEGDELTALEKAIDEYLNQKT